MRSSKNQSQKNAVTPLWVVALFVSLTETVLGIGVIKTTAAIQIALTAFVLIFPVLIALGFFLILWWRPYVFYPPAEFQHVAVRDYVSAMQSRPGMDGERFYSNIVEAVQTYLKSEETISLITSTLESGRNDKKKAADVLQFVAGEAAARIRKESFVTIDSTPLLGQERGRLSHVPYRPDQIISDFLDDVYFAIGADNLRPYSYKALWILRDRKSGKLFDSLGRLRTASRHYGPMGGDYDHFTISEVGIAAGMELEAISIAQAMAIESSL